MKQYTTPEQTAKLIGLGFKKPKFEIETQLCNIKGQPLRATTIVGDYSIGELIEMLPQYLDYKGGVAGMPINYHSLTIRRNIVMYCDPYMDWIEIQCDDHEELIDNLYDMVTMLKEEGVL